jgi:pyruvate/2-oxoglutarate dehydrogenase complex dihydrolipoamide dehydrogenase (E3) component
MSGCDTRILMKLVVDGTSDRVLGGHIVGDTAAEIIQATVAGCSETQSYFLRKA